MSQFEYHNAANDEASQKKSLAWMLANTSGKATTGVLSGLAVAQTTTASASVTIAAGAAVLQAATLDGASLLGLDTQLTLDILTANPVGGLPRNDIVVFDQATLTPVSGTATGGIRVIVGTPNASPTDPTVPTSAIALARLRHAASATTVPAAKIDDLRTFTDLRRPLVYGFEAAAQTSPQVIPASTVTAVRWNGLSENVGGFTLGGTPITITVPTGRGGLYAITTALSVANTQITRAYVDLYSSSGRIAERGTFTGDNRGGLGQTVRLADGDQIKVELFCATATTVNGGFVAAYRLGD